MKIPGFQNVLVDQNKITGYLLSETHPGGKHKARFFLRFGFTVDKPWVLLEALKNHASNDYIRLERNSFGTRYIIEAPLESPDGRNPPIRSVWFVETSGTVGNFVTAYPIVGG